ncbi:MAG: alpha-L-arabinofuranosidase C-terminal domain-containing protein [Marinilabiliaceae bacterium]
MWYRARSGENMTGDRALEERYNLEDALVISGILNAFIRNAHIVKMANMAQLVNVIGPIFTSEDEMFKQTIYYPLELFANNMHGTSLDLFVDCDTYDTEEFYLGLGETTTQQSDVPYLDVSATYKDNEVTIAVVNRHKDESIATDIISQTGKFDGSFEVYEVNGPNIKAENDFDKTSVKSEKKENIKANGTTVRYDFPPHSVTLMKGKIKQ